MEASHDFTSTKPVVTTLNHPNVTVLKVPREQLLKSPYPSTLPAEIIEAAERTHILYLLATNPQSVLPPGKTMVSALAALQLAPSAPPANTLEDHVQRAIHRAFWDQATSALSSPLPAEQLTRLKDLQDDLLNEMKPLFPPNHPIIISLSFPMSPTSDPLQSYALHLRSVAVALRAQCAPIRDTDVDGVITSLSDPSISGPTLAQKLVDATRKLFEFAKLMRTDLAHATIGRMEEVELTQFVRKQARERERSFIKEHWTIDIMEHTWRSWRSMEAGPWSVCLVRALGSSVAVSCSFPHQSPMGDTQTSQLIPPNDLPPYLFFAIPTLLRVQNVLQALTITACLRVLAGLPSGSPNAETFCARIFAILKTEIASPQETNDNGETSIAHLADEVISARVGSNSWSPSEHQVIRAAVDRTLRAEDPTFKLLHQRLLNALSHGLETCLGVSERSEAPRHLETGRRQGPPLDIRHHQLEDSSEEVIEAKGFEEACLREEAGAIVVELRKVIRWEEYVWGEAILNDRGKD